MSKHTPRPWKVVRSATCGHLRAEHNHQQNPRQEWTDADIALINAAPDLLAACKQIAEYADLIKQNYPDLSGLIRGMTAARAAIAKAEGGAA